MNTAGDEYREIFLEELNKAYEEGKISDADWSVIEGIKKTLPVPSYLLQIKNKAAGSYEVAVECKDLAYDRMYEVACQELYNTALEEGLEHFEEAEAANGHYSETYGLLYTYDAALAAIPEGWRLPSDADWKNLEKALGMTAEEVENRMCGGEKDRLSC